MREITGWLDRRVPRAPHDLAERVRAALAEVVEDADHEPSGEAGQVVDHSVMPGEVGLADADRSEPLARALLRAAVDRIVAARSRPGRVRRSAFDLLVADSLITYACEAALEADRPVETLERLTEVGKVE